MINLNHFYYFYVTAKYGGVTKAAEVLHIAQPSLSSQLKIFENSLGKKLFKKNGRKLELTPDGLATYNYSKRVFEIVDEFQKYNFDKINNGLIRSKIGVAREVERPFVADVLSKILKKHKKDKASIQMSTGEHLDLLDQLHTGDIDVLVTNTPSYNEGITTISSLSIPVYPVASHDYFKSIRLKKNFDLQTILKHPDLFLVLPTHKLKLRFETDLFLQKYEVSHTGIFETDILSAVVRATVEGVGIAFLPLVYIEKELKQQKLMLLTDRKKPSWSHKIYLTILDNKTLDPIGLEVRKFFESFS